MANVDVKMHSWLNLERGCFLGFALLATTSGVNFLSSRPRPVQEDITPPRVLESKRYLPGEDHLLAVDLENQRARDMLVPVELQISRTSRIQPVKPTPTPVPHPVPRPTDQELAHLPPKPRPKPVDAPDPKPAPDQPKQKPLPLKVIGIIKPDGSNGRRVVVAPVDDPTSYFTLGTGEECDAGGEHIKVASISFTSATFARENGKFVVVDKDPLKAWKPLLKAREDQEEDPADDIFAAMGQTPGKQARRPSPLPRKGNNRPNMAQLRKRYGNLQPLKDPKKLAPGGRIPPETMNKMLQEVKKHPGILDKLGEFF